MGSASLQPDRALAAAYLNKDARNDHDPLPLLLLPLLLLPLAADASLPPDSVTCCLLGLWLPQMVLLMLLMLLALLLGFAVPPVARQGPGPAAEASSGICAEACDWPDVCSTYCTRWA